MKSWVAPSSSGQFLVQKYLFWANRNMKVEINKAHLEHINTKVAGVVLQLQGPVSHENKTE